MKYNHIQLFENFFSRKKNSNNNQSVKNNILNIFDLIYLNLPEYLTTAFAHSNKLDATKKRKLDVEFDIERSDYIQGTYDGIRVGYKFSNDEYNIALPPKISDSVALDIFRSIKNKYHNARYDDSGFWINIKIIM